MLRRGERKRTKMVQWGPSIHCGHGKLRGGGREKWKTGRKGQREWRIMNRSTSYANFSPKSRLLTISYHNLRSTRGETQPSFNILETSGILTKLNGDETTFHLPIFIYILITGLQYILQYLQAQISCFVVVSQSWNCRHVHYAFLA